ncbi:hypothetical protein [Leptolyngbya sp. FACHB-321]|nr:hypothetical protein [Leptolyngbya sp. FACHB-321]
MSRTARSTYDYLMVRDLQLAADLLKQIHSQQTKWLCANGSAA